MEDLNLLIDAATFGSVRRYLRAAHSPITTVMLVQHRDYHAARRHRAGRGGRGGRECPPPAVEAVVHLG